LLLIEMSEEFDELLWNRLIEKIGVHLPKRQREATLSGAAEGGVTIMMVRHQREGYGFGWSVRISSNRHFGS
jgi:hypothetical protein